MRVAQPESPRRGLSLRGVIARAAGAVRVSTDGGVLRPRHRELAHEREHRDVRQLHVDDDLRQHAFVVGVRGHRARERDDEDAQELVAHVLLRHVRDVRREASEAELKGAQGGD
eukprot:30805-Pelagococcus_subviridis.AAC.8